MARRSRFFLNSFLRLPAAAAFPAAPASGVAFVGSFATSCSVSSKSAWCENPLVRLTSCGHGAQRAAPLQTIRTGARECPYRLALLAGDLLLGCDGAAARTLTGASVGVGALATNRQIAAMTNAAISLDFNQAANVHLDLFAEIAFDAAFLLDLIAEAVDFVFGEVANLFGGVDVGLFGELTRALLSDAVDRGKPDPQSLLHRKIYTSNTCHTFSFSLNHSPWRADSYIPGAACASGCCKSHEPRRGDG